MSKGKTTIDRTECAAAIGRTIKLLETLKTQLRAKKLEGRTLDDLLYAAKNELEPMAIQFIQLRHDQLDDFMRTFRQEA